MELGVAHCKRVYLGLSSLCQSSLTPGGFPQISDACAQGNMVAFASDTTQLFKRMAYSGSGPLSDTPSPVPSTHSIRLWLPAEIAVTTVFAEAVYLATQAVPASTLIVTKYFTSGVSPSPSGSASDDTGGNNQGALSGIAKIAIGVGSGIVGALLVLFGVILIRRHRKRQLSEAANDEMIVIPSYKGYNEVDPESGNRNKARFEPTRAHCELEATSPGDLDEDIICLYCPDFERSTEREYEGERTVSEVASGESDGFEEKYKSE
ncbi:hypothetical protein E0Z10_g6580 [Xylaria hypoxylon]|uniref:Mid2 domain-containing protein n=1 Tax=Xylaria hypoxylon TaxID=37992 RepID=A0A4Z0YD65_9PEZI|nr:hypothetical protein E0Z10_g6580 [Xylaria hypoxylon]